MSGFNWRDTLGDFAAVSGVLAGFTLAFVVFILGWSVADRSLVCGITWGNIGVLLNGISSTLFIAAAEFFLGAKELNAWGLTDKYETDLSDRFRQSGEDWEKIKEDDLTRCTQYEERGRHCYNMAIFLMFLALLFVIGPYQMSIAVLVAGLGIGLELFQMAGARMRRTVS